MSLESLHNLRCSGAIIGLILQTLWFECFDSIK